MKKISLLQKNILKNLIHHMKSLTPNHSFSEVYNYSLFPTGKLFRPLLAVSLSCDFLKIENLTLTPKDSQALLASAIEIHHSYTLIHDDLPCMDNDMTRRGKPSTHAKYNEWKALLAGDGLINGSYELLSKINSPNALQVLRIFSKLVGMKGLIQGQVLDLSEEMSKNFYSLIRTHTLKTARLIQASLLLSYLITQNKEKKYRTALDLLKLGEALGISFQLLDDLTEIDRDKLNPHEAKINPWLNFSKQTLSTLLVNLNSIEKYLDKYELNLLKKVIKEYFNKIEDTISDNQLYIIKHLSTIDLRPVIHLLKRLC